MNPRDPSRRSLLASLGAAFAWLFSPRAGRAAPPVPSPTVPPEAAPAVVRVPDPPAVTNAAPASGTLVYSTHGLPQTMIIDGTGRITHARMTWTDPGWHELARSATETAGERVATVHAACRLESPSGVFLGREEYEVVIRDGMRFVRVSSLDASGNAMKSELVPF